MVITQSRVFSPQAAANSPRQAKPGKPVRPEKPGAHPKSNIVPVRKGLFSKNLQPVQTKPNQLGSQDEVKLSRSAAPNEIDGLKAEMKAAPCPKKDCPAELAKFPTSLSNEDAEILARSAIMRKRLPEKNVLMRRIKLPQDMAVADHAIARVLNEANQGATAQQIKDNNLRALFLRDKMGDSLKDHATSTWHGRRVMLNYVLRVLPSHVFPKMPKERDLTKDGQLKPEAARKLTENFIHNGNHHEREALVEQVIGFNDLVTLEDEAMKVLEQANQNKSQREQDHHNMNFLFMMHDVGFQMANRIVENAGDRYKFMKHMMGA